MLGLLFNLRGVKSQNHAREVYVSLCMDGILRKKENIVLTASNSVLSFSNILTITEKVESLLKVRIRSFGNFLKGSLRITFCYRYKNCVFKIVNSMWIFRKAGAGLISEILNIKYASKRSS